MRPIISSPQSLPQQHALTRNLIEQSNTLTRLSTGLRLNTGADDPAGLVASENLRAVLSALDAESRAVERADAVVRTAEGALDEVSDLLRRAEGLAVANANSGGLSDAEIEANQAEIDSIIQSVDRIASTTEFNGESLLDGSFSINAFSESLDVNGVAARDLGETVVDEGTPDEEVYDLSDVASGGAINTVSGDVSIAVSVIRQASSDVTSLRGDLGNFSANTLSTERARIGTAIENISAAESLIRDADFAEETSALTRQSILADSSRAALGVVNASNSQILSLLLG